MRVISKAVANCESPKYISCEFGNFHPQPNKINTTTKDTMKEQDIKKYHLLTGHMVSADHYISRDPVNIYHTRCKLFTY